MTKEYRKSGQNIFTPMQGLKDLINSILRNIDIVDTTFL